MSRYESIIYPMKMKKGDTLGVAAPSSPFDHALFDQGVSILNNRGFDVVIPDDVWARDGFLAGTDDQRVSVLHALFRDPAVKGIVCARGGYGSMRLLDKLDFDLIRANPKPFIGFSDVSALLAAIHMRTGLVCYHGPVVTSLAISDDKSIEAFESILTGDGNNMVGAAGKVVFPGKADGVLKGGNLATLCHLTGTNYAPNFDDGILMLEDVGEAPYKIDRMLTQMKMAGLFNNIRAVVGGRFERCGESGDIERVFSRVFQDLGIPVVLDFPFGHGAVNMAFPEGAEAVFDTDSMEVVFDER